MGAGRGAGRPAGAAAVARRPAVGPPRTSRRPAAARRRAAAVARGAPPFWDAGLFGAAARSALSPPAAGPPAAPADAEAERYPYRSAPRSLWLPASSVARTENSYSPSARLVRS